MQNRIAHWLVVAGLFGVAGWLTYREARSSRVLDEVHSEVLLALDRDSEAKARPAMVTIHRDYTCNGKTATATATYDPTQTTPTTAGTWLDDAIQYLTTTCSKGR